MMVGGYIMEDKSVATEEVCFPSLGHSTCIEVARLEAVLRSLAEHKVEAIKSDSIEGIGSGSPLALIRRLRITSSSTASSKDKDSSRIQPEGGKRHRRRKRGDDARVERINPKSLLKVVPGFQPETTTTASRPEEDCCSRVSPCGEEDAFLAYEATNSGACCCGEDVVEVRINPIPKYDEDYVSLRMDDDEYDVAEELEERRKQRRHRRRQRRRRRRKRRTKGPVGAGIATVVEDVKVLDPDELSQRARWTIVVTACLLLFMCLMLVGITLRMAPLIDDMVRKENEELMNQLQRESPLPDIQQAQPHQTNDGTP